MVIILQTHFLSIIDLAKQQIVYTDGTFNNYLQTPIILFTDNDSFSFNWYDENFNVNFSFINLATLEVKIVNWINYW